jgi:hypothetical protein
MIGEFENAYNELKLIKHSLPDEFESKEIDEILMVL